MVIKCHCDDKLSLFGQSLDIPIIANITIEKLSRCYKHLGTLSGITEKYFFSLMVHMDADSGQLCSLCSKLSPFWAGSTGRWYQMNVSIRKSVWMFCWVYWYLKWCSAIQKTGISGIYGFIQMKIIIINESWICYYMFLEEGTINGDIFL